MFPEDIIYWFKSRGISEVTLRYFGIWWNGSNIVIPIKDPLYKTLFNKYRRNPIDEKGPKYTYDKGAKISLYNYDPTQNKILFCEGELDAVRLHEIGVHAVSSTGGAGSFQEEWLETFKDKNLIVCLDNDDAGIKGMLKIALLRPETRFISFPQYWKGKDVTDFLKNHTPEEFLKLMESAYELPIPKVDDVHNIKKSLSLCIDLRRTLKNKNLSQTLLENFVNYLSEERIKIKNKKEKKEFTENIDNIKNIPITDFIDFNIAGFSKCIFGGHRDKTPSMKYFKDSNTVYCFGCSSYADIISVVRIQRKLDFVNAIKYLKEKYGIKN